MLSILSGHVNRGYKEEMENFSRMPFFFFLLLFLTTRPLETTKYKRRVTSIGEKAATTPRNQFGLLKCSLNQHYISTSQKQTRPRKTPGLTSSYRRE